MIKAFLKRSPLIVRIYEWFWTTLHEWHYRRPRRLKLTANMSLTQLAKAYGCDKLYSHSYLPFYEWEFRNRRVKRLLEIGIGHEQLMKPFIPFYKHGSSLRMWEAYFKDAEIFACDIREDTLINEGRIRSMVCDQSDYASLMEMVRVFTEDGRKQFDVIIDDGSHQIEHQALTVRYLLPHLADDGIYVIEDVEDPERLVRILLGRGEIYRLQGKVGDCLVVLRKTWTGGYR